VSDTRDAFREAGLPLKVVQGFDDSLLPRCLRSDLRSALKRIEPGVWLEPRLDLSSQDFLWIAVGKRNPGGVNDAGCSEPASLYPTATSARRHPIPVPTVIQDGNIVVVIRVHVPAGNKFEQAMKLLFNSAPPRS
jgi:hypothetical protein